MCTEFSYLKLHHMPENNASIDAAKHHTLAPIYFPKLIQVDYYLILRMT